MKLQKTAFLLVLALAVLAVPRASFARVRLSAICGVYGQKEVLLIGRGLVIGLNGTGDNKIGPTTRALANLLKNTDARATEEELSKVKNVALVLVTAVIPKRGIVRGQKIECRVSSLGTAKTLRGGQLLITPLETDDLRKNTIVALASGGIRIPDKSTPTTGVIDAGVTLERSFTPKFVDNTRAIPVVTLLIDRQHAGFQTAADVAHAINSELISDDAAKAIGGIKVEVKIPKEYRDYPVDFVSQVLEIGIDAPNSQARVLVNTKSQTIVISGEVEISPVIIRSKSVTVEVGQGSAFVPLLDPKVDQGSRQLKQLVNALNQLKAPQSEIIDIIRDIHRQGKLHAVYEEY